MRKKIKAERITLSDFKLSCKATLGETVWYQYKNTDPWNRILSPKMNPHLYGQLIYNKGGKSIQWGKDTLFNKWCWENWTAICKRIELDFSLTPCKKLIKNKDLNVRLESIKLLEGNIGIKLFSPGLSKLFFAIYLLRQRKQKKKK